MTRPLWVYYLHYENLDENQALAAGTIIKHQVASPYGLLRMVPVYYLLTL